LISADQAQPDRLGLLDKIMSNCFFNACPAPGQNGKRFNGELSLRK
jgi:hypothetical protein